MKKTNTPSTQQAVTRRAGIIVSNAPTLRLGDLTLHPDENSVNRNGKPIKLRKKEYQLLEFMALNKNKVMNRNTLLEYVWNYNVQSLTNTLEVHMSNLRRKIDGDYANKIIHTVYGLGYKLCDNGGDKVSTDDTPPAAPIY